MKTCTMLMLMTVTLVLTAQAADKSCCEAGVMCALSAATTNAAVETAAAAAKPQTLCPVMAGQPINRKLFVDYDGKRIYVCCKGCLAAVKKDPATYVKQLEDAGVTLERVPAETVK